MVTETDDSRLGRLEGQAAQQSIALQDISRRLDTGLVEIRQELRVVNTRIDRLTLAILGIGGGVIVALISLVGILAARLFRGG
jgi:uncharacterized coiled-coil protein SlyX